MIRSLLIGRLWAPLVALLLLAAPASARRLISGTGTGSDGTWDLATQNWATTSRGPVDYTWLTTANQSERTSATRPVQLRSERTSRPSA